MIDDAEVGDPAAVRRLYLVSGKFFYTLREARIDQQADDAAIVRVEQLYPWPVADYKALFDRYRKLQEVVWVQEEPENMGAWRHLRHRMEEDLPSGVSLRHVSRDAAAVPATGSYDVHRESELAILHSAFRKRRSARKPNSSAEGRRRRSS